jgi:hypothetical protein
MLARDIGIDGKLAAETERVEPPADAGGTPGRLARGRNRDARTKQGGEFLEPGIPPGLGSVSDRGAHQAHKRVREVPDSVLIT